MKSQQIVIDLVSDYACPWCYIGEMRLKKGIQLFQELNPSIQFKINYHPFMIDPSISPEGEDYLEYNKKRWGSDSWAVQMKSTARKEGINFKKWMKWPNTLLLHTLMLYAKQFEKEALINEILFRKIYEDGASASSKSELEKTAEEAKLDEQKAMQFIEDKNNQETVKLEDIKAKNRDIDGVPFFIIKCGGKVQEVGGAQKAELFKHIFTEVMK